jgi:hypothetical protein
VGMRDDWETCQTKTLGASPCRPFMFVFHEAMNSRFLD